MLLDKLDPIYLNGQRDKVVWRLESKGQYTTKSMYRFLISRVCRTDVRSGYGKENANETKDVPVVSFP